MKGIVLNAEESHLFISQTLSTESTETNSRIVATISIGGSESDCGGVLGKGCKVKLDKMSVC